MISHIFGGSAVGRDRGHTAVCPLSADYNIQDGATATLFTTSMRGGAADGDGADGGAVSTS